MHEIDWEETMYMPNDPTGEAARRMAAAAVLAQRSTVDARSVYDLQCALRGEGLQHQEKRNG